MSSSDAARREHPGSQAAAWTERTPADLSSLLLELGRVLKGALFYGHQSPSTASLASRAWRAWRADLDRAGPLELRVGAGFVVLDGLAERTPISHLTELAEALEASGVERIRVGGEISQESFRAFVAALVPDGRDETSIHAVPGIEVNGVAAPRGHSNVAAPPAVAEPAPSPPSPPSPPAAALAAPAAPEPRPKKAPLTAALEALDACRGDEPYRALAAEVALAAAALTDAGSLDAVHEAVLLLAKHASGAGTGSALCRRIARGTLVGVVQGQVLDELIFRACSNDTAESVGAAQALLQVGELAVPAILDHLESAPEDARAERLTALVVALGDVAAPCVGAAIESANETRARTSIRIAGNLQAPALAAQLGARLTGPHEALAKEAAKALVGVGNSAAADALVEGVRSADPRIARISAFCLGTLGAPQTLRALVERLHAAGRQRDWQLVREILGSVGQFRQCDPASAERLKGFICQPRLGWRRPPMDLRLEAVAALGQLSGPSVERALRELASQQAPRKSARLRKRASRILARRAPPVRATG